MKPPFFPSLLIEGLLVKQNSWTEKLKWPEITFSLRYKRIFGVRSETEAACSGASWRNVSLSEQSDQLVIRLEAWQGGRGGEGMDRIDCLLMWRGTIPLFLSSLLPQLPFFPSTVKPENNNNTIQKCMWLTVLVKFLHKLAKIFLILFARADFA